MLAWSVAALIISGASGETTRCAAGPEVVHAYGEDAHCSDSASLLQMKAMEHVHRESDVVAALHSASSTRRCGKGAYGSDGDCSFSDWSDWGGCSKTCGSGERSRERTVKTGTCDDACLKEDETCNSDSCAGTSTTQAPIPTGAPVSGVSGTVKDAKSNSAIAGATVRIQSLEATTDAVGGFHFTGATAGQASLTATADTYADYSEELKIEEGMSEISIKMVKPPTPGEWVIVMTWEKLPMDLELTTRFGAGEGKCYIAPAPGQGDLWDDATKQCTEPASGTEAKIDIDNYDKQGTGRNGGDTPETTTLTNVNEKTGRIIVRVDNWKRIVSSPGVFECNPEKSQYNPTTCGPVADSTAKVEVHGPETEKTFTVGKDGTDDGKFWYVCSIDGKTGIVSPCESVADCE